MAGIPVTFEVWQDGMLLETETATLDAAGNYEFETSVQGIIEIRAKASHWLARRASVATPGHADFTLSNGDINNDNRINVLDYIQLKANYNKIGLDGHPADLNGDSRINVLDYIILKKNYNKIGE